MKRFFNAIFVGIVATAALPLVILVAAFGAILFGVVLAAIWAISVAIVAMVAAVGWGHVVLSIPFIPKAKKNVTEELESLVAEGHEVELSGFCGNWDMTVDSFPCASKVTGLERAVFGRIVEKKGKQS